MKIRNIIIFICLIGLLCVFSFNLGKSFNTPILTKADTGLPKSNVLYFELEDNAWCCARPSGTEPKVKFYMGVKGSDFEDATNKLETLKNDMMELVK